MSVLSHFVKAPADVLDYDVDFARWLETGDTISSATAAATADTVTIDSTVVSDTQVKVWISGGSNGDVATTTITAVTANGRTKTACIKITVKEC
ncbi:hypothetical protein [Oricola sp.]|uniref:phage fiber-tail adaptor protein n=1 Tax=Oricola sp. TaxID=1979950 RepID=UPI003BAB614A